MNIILTYTHTFQQGNEYKKQIHLVRQTYNIHMEKSKVHKATPVLFCFSDIMFTLVRIIKNF